MKKDAIPTAAAEITILRGIMTVLSEGWPSARQSLQEVFQEGKIKREDVFGNAMKERALKVIITND